MSPKGSKTGVASTRLEFLIGNLCVILCMMGARRWPKAAVELPLGQMQFGRPPTHQAGLVILGDEVPSYPSGSSVVPEELAVRQDAEPFKYIVFPHT